MLALYHAFLVWLDHSKYILLFLGAIVEGPVLMMTSGFLYKLGQLNFTQTYTALVGGDFVADMLWYCVGYFAAQPAIYRFGKFINVTPQIIEKVENRFQKYHIRILIISKLTMGFGFAIATLITAGIFKVDFRKYAVLNLLGGFVWTAFLMTVGYFFGNIFALIPEYLKVVFVIAAIVGAYFVVKIVSKRLEKLEI